MAKFQKGQSGNPAGRKPAIASVNFFRNQVEEKLPQLIKQTLELALAGDPAATKLIFDRTFPTIKPQSLPVTIPQGDTLTSTGENILSNTLTGQLPPDVAAMLITALANQAKIIEQTELIKRIEALEALK